MSDIRDELADIQRLIEFCRQGKLYEDYDESTAIIAKARDAVKSIRAELAERPPAAVPPGYKLVPVEPTEAMMIEALREANPLGELVDWDIRDDDADRSTVALLYSTMLQSAPEPESRDEIKAARLRGEGSEDEQ